ncbi:unnamed protein product, partial [Allacma fusca]
EFSSVSCSSGSSCYRGIERYNMATMKAISAAVVVLVGVVSMLQLVQCDSEYYGSLPRLSQSDDKFLDELERATFLFFWEQASPKTGQIKDRAFTHGINDTRPIASIASTGFGLSALAIAHEREYRNRSEILERVRTTLRFIWNGLPHEHGFYYHFVDMDTGERAWNCELSSIDTAILINGVIHVGEYFQDDFEIKYLAAGIYERVDYAWMMQNETTLSMGWTPENGFLEDRWNRYCELLMLILQGIGSPTHPIPVSSWNAFKRETLTYENMTYIMTAAPIFIHQFSHAWFDFRYRRDNYTDYFENSVIATLVTKRWNLSLRNEFPSYGENFWGITASDTPYGYQAWGGPPLQGDVDGSIVPCAAAGSLPFLPYDTLSVLRNVKTNYPKAWDRYGFIDAFNPLIDWYNPDVIGIDLGVTILMAENLRTGFVWDTFMTNPHILRAMEAVDLTLEN